MSEFFNKGFSRRRQTPPGLERRLPPGQYFERGFPVLTVGQSPNISTAEWRFRIEGQVQEPKEWSWDELRALPCSRFDGDVHCVTSWSKLATSFAGISVDVLLEAARPTSAATEAVAYSYGGYTTNLPLADLTGNKAWVVWEHEGQPLAREHGGPARLLVPHLYFWKSAKWVAGLRLLDHEEKGFWETNGYHNRGDPWLQQRYEGD